MRAKPSKTTWKRTDLELFREHSFFYSHRQCHPWLGSWSVGMHFPNLSDLDTACESLFKGYHHWSYKIEELVNKVPWAGSPWPWSSREVFILAYRFSFLVVGVHIIVVWLLEIFMQARKWPWSSEKFMPGCVASWCPLAARVLSAPRGALATKPLFLSPPFPLLPLLSVLLLRSLYSIS